MVETTESRDAWLIERIEHAAGHEWWSGEPGAVWTGDAYRAAWFSSREAAESAINSLRLGGYCIVTEHVFALRSTSRDSEVREAATSVVAAVESFGAEYVGLPVLITNLAAILDRSSEAAPTRSHWVRTDPATAAAGEATFTPASEAAPVVELSESDVRTVIEHSSPFRNCQYAAAFRAPCPEVHPGRPEDWCVFCAAHARLAARLTQTRTPGESE